MRQTLTDRRAQIAGKITQVEQSTLTVTIAPIMGEPLAPSATTVAEILAAVHDEMWAAAATLDWPDEWPDDQRNKASTLHVGQIDDGHWTLELRRPAGPLGTHPTTPDGDRLAFDAALDRLIDRIDDGEAQDLMRLVLDHDLPLTLEAAPVDGDTRTAQLDQQTAQSLLLDA